MNTKDILKDLEDSGFDSICEEMDMFVFLMFFGTDLLYPGLTPKSLLKTCKN